jgi:hypothetical protein
MQILRAASSNTANVWLQLDYARQLRKAGQKQQAATRWQAWRSIPMRTQ